MTSVVIFKDISSVFPNKFFLSHAHFIMEVLCDRSHSIVLFSMFFSTFLFFSFQYLYEINQIYCKESEGGDIVPLKFDQKTDFDFPLFKVSKVISIDEYTSDEYPPGNIFLPDVSEIPVSDSVEVGYPVRISNGPYDGLDNEAAICIKLAKKYKEKSNHEKSKKLLEHALALSPKNSEALLLYGEVLEATKDVVRADHFYVRALIVAPKNSRALANHNRVLPVVNEIDKLELSRIDRIHKTLIHSQSPHLKRVRKELYFSFIHHTVAIEGNTFSLAETRTVLETQLAVPGKSISMHNEILGIDAALQFMNVTLVNRKEHISINDILDLHKRVMGYVNPIASGRFRTGQVYVGDHTPPPASEIVGLLRQFLNTLFSPEMSSMHPISVAAYAHYQFVYIHPFEDGNGRTARLLMNYFFMKSGYPPINVSKNDRPQYYATLQIANEGDKRPFYRFIAYCTEKTLNQYLCAHDQSICNIKALESKSDSRDIIPLGASYI